MECLRDFLNSQPIEFAFLLNSRITSGQFYEMIGEAHSLEWEVLEEIRLLGNMENWRGKLIQVILAGQPELARKLAAPNLRQLKQRIVLRCKLQQFRTSDTADCINIRMEKANQPDRRAYHG